MESGHKAEELAEHGAGGAIRWERRHRKLKPYRAAEKAERKAVNANAEYLYQKALHDNPEMLSGNPLNRFFQKQRLKREYAKAARTAKAAGSTAQATAKSAEKTAEATATAAKIAAEKAKEAQVLYVLALSDYAEQTDFVSKLLGCFAEEQTDKQLIIAVNTAFGTTLNAEDFTKVMTAIRAKAINTSGFTEPDTKNAHDLVEWAKQAHAKKWGYVWGTYGDVLTEAVLNGKVSQYPDEVGGKEEYIRTHWLGGRTADCIGLIKGYGWYDCEGGSITYGTNDMPDIGADTMYENATEKGTIDTLPETPGLALWHEGHIGIYIGNGHVIHAANTNDGVILSEVSGSGFTHWLKIPYIDYDEPIEKEN